MDPKSADDLVAAFLQFDARPGRQRRRVLGRGRRLLRRLGPEGRVRPRSGQSGRQHRFPQERPRHAARAARPIAPGADQAGDRRGRRPGRRRRHGAGHVVRRARDGGERLLRRLLPPLGRAADRRRHGAPAAPGRHGQGDGDHHDRPQGDGRGELPHRPVREGGRRTARRARRPRRWRRRSPASRRSACARTGRRPIAPGASRCARAWRASGRRAPHIVKAEGIAGATRFAKGKGRHGDFGDI